MGTETPTRYGIQQLVQASGVPRRTVRYYVQLGLLPPPSGAGRGHYYTPEHLGRLLRIRELRNAGRSLEEIRYLLSGVEREAHEELPPTPVIEPAAHIRVADGLEVVVSGRAKPPTPSQLQALAVAAARILGTRSRRPEED